MSAHRDAPESERGRRDRVEEVVLEQMIDERTGTVTIYDDERVEDDWWIQAPSRLAFDRGDLR